MKKNTTVVRVALPVLVLSLLFLTARGETATKSPSKQGEASKKIVMPGNGATYVEGDYIGPSKKEVEAAVKRAVAPLINLIKNLMTDLKPIVQLLANTSNSDSREDVALKTYTNDISRLSAEVFHGDVLLPKSLNDKVTENNTGETNERLNEAALKTEALITKLNHEKGSLGHSSLYNNFSQTLSSLDSALVNLKKRQPGGYVVLNEVALKTDTLITKLHNEKSTLGHLSSDPTLYNDLSRTLSSLDSVLVDLKRKPERYVKFTLF